MVSPPNRDKLTMRFKPLNSLHLILSPSKDEAGIPHFSASLVICAEAGSSVVQLKGS
jgi:hypothetical protein